MDSLILSNIVAIKKFFNTTDYPPVTNKELMEMSSEERAELGRLSAEAIGAQIG